MYELHGRGRGIAEAIVRTVLHEKGLPFEAVAGDADDLALVHPEDGVRVEGLRAILDHLERTVPEPALRGVGAEEAALLAALLDDLLPVAARCRAAVDAGAAVDAADRARLARVLADVADRAAMAPFLAGEGFTAADVVWFWTLALLDGVGSEARTALAGGAAHREAVSARASIQRILAGGDPLAAAA